MALLAVTYIGGKWWNYSISDYVSNFFKLFLSSDLENIACYLQPKKREDADGVQRKLPLMMTPNQKRCAPVGPLSEGYFLPPYRSGFVSPAGFCRSDLQSKI